MFRIFDSIRFALFIVYVFLYWDCVIVVSYYHHIYCFICIISAYALLSIYRLSFYDDWHITAWHIFPLSEFLAHLLAFLFDFSVL